MPSLGAVIVAIDAEVFHQKAREINATESEIGMAQEILRIGRQITGIRALFSPDWKEIKKQEWRNLYSENPRAAQIVKAVCEAHNRSL